jgi:hypothetical protein
LNHHASHPTNTTITAHHYSTLTVTRNTHTTTMTSSLDQLKATGTVRDTLSPLLIILSVGI